MEEEVKGEPIVPLLISMKFLYNAPSKLYSLSFVVHHYERIRSKTGSFRREATLGPPNLYWSLFPFGQNPRRAISGFERSDPPSRRPPRTGTGVIPRGFAA